MEKDEACKMDRQNKNVVVLERVGEGRIMLELIKKRKWYWLGHRLRRDCQLKDALEGMLNGKKFRCRRRYQMMDNIMINGLWRYEKEGWEEGRVENAEFAVKYLHLGRTLWLIENRGSQPGGRPYGEALQNFRGGVVRKVKYHLPTNHPDLKHKSRRVTVYRVLKNNVYNVSGMIEEVKTNTFFIWQTFDLCTVLPLDGLMGTWIDFRHNTHRLVLFVLLCLQQVERVITVSTKTCYDQ